MSTIFHSFSFHTAEVNIESDYISKLKVNKMYIRLDWKQKKNWLENNYVNLHANVEMSIEWK